MQTQEQTLGTIRKRGDKFQGIVRLSTHEPQYQTFATRKAASAWIRDTEIELESRKVTSPDLLISELIERYETEIAPKRKMADSHLGHDTPSIKRSFAGMRMRDLQGRGLIDWVLKQGTAASTRNWHVARLYGVLRQVESHWEVAVPWADMNRSRDRLWELGYITLPEERSRRVSDEELAAIKANIAKGTRIPACDIFDFALKSAMRIGEICRVTWDDFNEATRTLVIRDRKHPRKKFGNHQEIPLLGGSFEIVQRQPRGEARIFPCRPECASKVFHGGAKRAGLTDVVLHDLRHEGISRLFEMGFEIQEVALVSGHRDWKLLRRYTHLRPGSLIEKERRLKAAA